jgi:Domain of unknown function (DUF222)/HNH endonuclease
MKEASMAFEPTGQTADAVAALEDAIAAAARAAATLDALLPRLATHQRWEAVARVGDLGRAADALRLRVADDIAKRHDGVPKEDRFTLACGYGTSVEMLTGELGISRRNASRLLRVAAVTRPRIGLTGAALPARFPTLGGALAAGAVSIDAVAAIVDSLGDAADRANPAHVAAAEQALVEHAMGQRGMHPSEMGVVDRAMPPELLAQVGRKWRDALDPDGVEPRYDDQLAARSFRFGTRADGLVAGTLVCTPDQGAVLSAAFDAFTKPRKPRFDDGDERKRDREPSVDDRTRGQKMVDALIAMIQGAVERRDVPRVGKEAPVVVIQATKEAFDAAAAGHTGRTATIERTGDVIPIAVAAAIACNGYIQNVVTGAKGLPLYLGRRQRYFNRAQRRALGIRDGGCRAPGCTAPVGWCDAHHILPWSEGGPTDISNGILLCPFHHHEVHRGMLEVVWASGGWVVRSHVRAPRRQGWADELRPEQLHLQQVT